MSAKRRTSALASGVWRYAPMASERKRFELPATILIAPLFAAIARLSAGLARQGDNKPAAARQYRAEPLSRSFFSRLTKNFAFPPRARPRGGTTRVLPT